MTRKETRPTAAVCSEILEGDGLLPAGPVGYETHDFPFGYAKGRGGAMQFRREMVYVFLSVTDGDSPNIPR